jgi:hypothetical protein
MKRSLCVTGLALAVLSAPAAAQDSSAVCVLKGGAPPVALLRAVKVVKRGARTELEFRFRGPHAPPFVIEEARRPVLEDASGEPTKIAGSYLLMLRMQPAAGADLSGAKLVRTYWGPPRIKGPRGSPLREAVMTGDFEAVMTWVLGLDKKRQVSVRHSCHPPRIVAGINH